MTTSKTKAAITGDRSGWLPQKASTASSTTELKYPNGPVGGAARRLCHAGDEHSTDGGDAGRGAEHVEPRQPGVGAVRLERRRRVRQAAQQAAEPAAPDGDDQQAAQAAR